MTDPVERKKWLKAAGEKLKSLVEKKNLNLFLYIEERRFLERNGSLKQNVMLKVK